MIHQSDQVKDGGVGDSEWAGLGELLDDIEDDNIDPGENKNEPVDQEGAEEVKMAPQIISTHDDKDNPQKKVSEITEPSKGDQYSPPKLNELLKDLSELEESKQPRQTPQTLFLVRK